MHRLSSIDMQNQAELMQMDPPARSHLEPNGSVCDISFCEYGFDGWDQTHHCLPLQISVCMSAKHAIACLCTRVHVSRGRLCLSEQRAAAAYDVFER